MLDHEVTQKLAERGGKGQEAWLLTFDWLLSQTSFPELMQKMLKTVERAYRYPVDIEFTVNFDAAGTTVINLVHRITSYNVCYTKLLRKIQ